MAANYDAIKQYQKLYAQYQAEGNTAGMAAAHAAAEAERAKENYSGGADGGQHLSPDASGTGSPRSAESRSDAIAQLYAAQRESKLAALKSAYDRNMAELDAKAAELPEAYSTARNGAAAASALAQAGFNARAAGTGLNSGAGGQAALAYGNTLAANLSSLDQKQAQAVSDLGAQRQKLAAAYGSAIAQAAAENDGAKAQALYNEAVRADNSLVSASHAQATLALRKEDQQNALSQHSEEKALAKAKMLAAAGDFSGYAQLYGLTDEQLAWLKKVYAAENPKTARIING